MKVGKNMTKDGYVEAGWNLDNTYIRLPEFLYSKVNLNPVCLPEIIVLNASVAKLLGLEVNALRREEGVNILAGNALPPGVVPIAQAYGGHQFGHFSILGDGNGKLLIGSK